MNLLLIRSFRHRELARSDLIWFCFNSRFQEIWNMIMRWCNKIRSQRMEYEPSVRWRPPWRIRVRCWFAASRSLTGWRSASTYPRTCLCCPRWGTVSRDSWSHSPCSCSSSRGTLKPLLEAPFRKPRLRRPTLSPAYKWTQRWRDWWTRHPVGKRFMLVSRV